MILPKIEQRFLSQEDEEQLTNMPKPSGLSKAKSVPAQGSETKLGHELIG